MYKKMSVRILLQFWEIISIFMYTQKLQKVARNLLNILNKDEVIDNNIHKISHIKFNKLMIF